MFAIYKKELRSYFSNVIGWLFIAFLLFFTGIFATSINLKQMSASFEYVVVNASLVLLLGIPVLTMKSVADEKGQKTDKLLYSLPMKASSIIIGKYLAMVTVIFIASVVMAIYPIIISLYGIIDYTLAYTAIFGFFLLGCALSAIGLFLSSLTESMVIAAVLSFTSVLLLYIMDGAISILPADATGSFICFCVLFVILGIIAYALSKNQLVGIISAACGVIPTSVCYMLWEEKFEGLFPKLVSFLAVFDRFYNFAYGVFDITAIVYFLSVIVFFVFLTVLSLEKKRWN
ncbi:MAG: ABC transporter [Ruminococcaceae bacterium]|nr:ABC transporter [Oscillospiraceae bacterium]